MNQAVTESADRLHGSVEKIAQSAHQAVDRVASRAAPAIDQARSAAAHAGEAVSARLDDLTAMQDEWMESMRDQVRAHPLAVVGVAVLAGLLIGRIMR
jgi:ElaB/YqjD/DUF883 family membrane-anchored ribosome-binding protein